MSDPTFHKGQRVRNMSDDGTITDPEPDLNGWVGVRWDVGIKQYLPPDLLTPLDLKDELMNPEPTIGTKWTTSIDTKTFRVVGMVDGLVVSRYAADRRATVDAVDWWRKHAIIIPDPPKIKAGYSIVWEDAAVGAAHATPDVAWRLVDAYHTALGVVEVIPDGHGGARLVPVDRDGRRIGEAT